MDELSKDDQEFLEALPPTENPEAPQSGNVTGYFNGFSIQITCRDPKVELQPLVKKMSETATYMSSLGFLPSWNDQTNEAFRSKSTNGASIPVSPVLPPVANPTPMPDLTIDGDKGQGGVCPVHGTKLVWKTGISKTKKNADGSFKPYAFWSCPTLNADGSFCKAGSQRK